MPCKRSRLLVVFAAALASTSVGCGLFSRPNAAEKKIYTKPAFAEAAETPAPVLQENSALQNYKNAAQREFAALGELLKTDAYTGEIQAQKDKVVDLCQRGEETANWLLSQEYLKQADSLSANVSASLAEIKDIRARLLTVK